MAMAGVPREIMFDIIGLFTISHYCYYVPQHVFKVHEHVIDVYVFLQVTKILAPWIDMMILWKLVEKRPCIQWFLLQIEVLMKAHKIW
jgi:hypothetical protein